MGNRSDQQRTRESLTRLREPKYALLLGILGLALVFAATATWGEEGQTRDSTGAAAAGWNLVQNQSLDLSEFAANDAWLVETEHGWLSNRAPGLIAFSAVGYLIAYPFTDGFVFWPATLIAVVTSSLAVGYAVLTSWKLQVRWAPWPFVMLGLATSVWSVASDQLWPHGPAALFIALAVWSLATEREWLAGIALGMALLIRPPVAVIAVVVGLGLAFYRRSTRPLFQIGLPSSVAAAVYLVYNQVLFGSWSPVAPYEASGGLTTATGTVEGGLEKILTVFLSPRYGVLVWTPWILVGLVGLHRVWRSSPDWAKLLPLAGFAYLAVHVQLNRVSGGLPYNYRYAIEAVALAAPILFAALWASREDRVMKYFGVLMVLVAIGLQVAFMFVSECTGIGTPNPRCGLFGL